MASRKARGLFFEFTAIFAGVFLGLLADDWRDRTTEAQEARDALEILYEDLAADSVGIEDLRGPLERHVSVASWFQWNWSQEALPQDSIGGGIRILMFVNDPHFRRSAYTSLRDGDRLALIRSNPLRNAIVSYFEGVQASANFYVDGHYQQRQVMINNVLTHHMLLPSGREDGSVWPIVAGPVPLTSSWPEIRADNEVHNQIAAVGWWADIALRYLDQAQEENAALREMIRRELGGIPNGTSGGR